MKVRRVLFQSEAALNGASGGAQFLLNWLEPEEAVRANIDRIKAKSGVSGKPLSYALRVGIVARRTEEEAWREIARGWGKLSEQHIHDAFGGNTSVTESVGAARQRSFRPDIVRHWSDLRSANNRWGGFNLLRPGPPIGLVGSYEQVAEQLQNLIDLGVGSFVLAATPHLEEAQRIGENVLPLLNRSIKLL